MIEQDNLLDTPHDFCHLYSGAERVIRDVKQQFSKRML